MQQQTQRKFFPQEEIAMGHREELLSTLSSTGLPYFSWSYPHFTSQQVGIYVVHFLSANVCWIKPSTFPGLKAAQVLIYPWLSVRDAIIPAYLKDLHSSLKPSFSGLIIMILPSCRTVLQDNHTWNGFSIHVPVHSKNGWEIIRVQSYSSLQFSRVLAPYSL